jgi:hypothetical protein
MYTSNWFKLVLLINGLVFAATALMVGKLIATNASVVQRPYSWNDDWLMLAIIVTLALLNVVTLWFVVEREK